MTQQVGGPPDWYHRRRAIDPHHPDVEWYHETQQALWDYQQRVAAAPDPAVRQEAARAHKRATRIAYWRRVRRRILYSSPQQRAPQKPKEPGVVEQTCNGCDRIERQVEICTCGCLPLMMVLPVLATPATPEPRARPTVPARAGLAAIRAYQRGISAHTPARCRYTPTCSQYGAQAVRRYGLGAGSRLIAARLHRCTPDVPHGTPDPLN